MKKLKSKVKLKKLVEDSQRSSYVKLQPLIHIERWKSNENYSKRCEQFTQQTTRSVNVKLSLCKHHSDVIKRFDIFASKRDINKTSASAIVHGLIACKFLFSRIKFRTDFV